MNETVFTASGTSFNPINISRNHFENCTARTLYIQQSVQTSIFLDNNVWINCTNSGDNFHILRIYCDRNGTTIQHQDSIRTIYNTKWTYLDIVHDESSVSSTNVSDISLPGYSSLCLFPGKGQSASQKFMIYSRLKATDDVIAFFPRSMSKCNARSSNFVELDTGGNHFYTSNSLTIIKDSFISLKQGQDSIKCYAGGVGGEFWFRNCCLEQPISIVSGTIQIENSKDFLKCTMIPIPPEKKPEQFSPDLNLGLLDEYSKFLFFSPFSLSFFDTS